LPEQERKSKEISFLIQLGFKPNHLPITNAYTKLLSRGCKINNLEKLELFFIFVTELMC